MTGDLYDLTPLTRLMLLGALIALAPAAWVWLRHTGQAAQRRWQALAVLTLFLTFDLVLFGAFTRLTDSGLGCPDWPGCYGHASPMGAAAQIRAEVAVRPDGPVTPVKAWIEMVHRYFATGLGALITATMAAAWVQAWRRASRPGTREPGPSRAWATAAFVWVCLQGAFGALTVTWKLYPAIVTAHLLGGLAGLALLTAQVRSSMPWPAATNGNLARRWVWLLWGLLWLQCALGGWVSTNYAVLACPDFPSCDGRWWPPMNFADAFTLMRDLGHTADGRLIDFEALVAIHVVHRIGALVVLSALLGVGVWLARCGAGELRRHGLALVGVAVWQFVTGLSNVVLGWPLLAALAHTAGAAASIVVCTSLLVGMARAKRG